MPRRVKDFIDISEFTSLDDLIRYLETVRDNLPPEHQAELKIRGDEVFGRRLTITYFREQTPEEVELESKYSDGDEAAGRASRSFATSSTRCRSSSTRRTGASASLRYAADQAPALPQLEVAAGASRAWRNASSSASASIQSAVAILPAPSSRYSR